MTIAAQLGVVRAALAAWALNHRGTAAIAGDPVHLFSLLRSGVPGAVRALVIFQDELKRGEIEEAGFVDRTYVVIVSRGRGFTIEPSDSLVKTVGSGEALYDLVEGVRDVLRDLQFGDDTEDRPDVKKITLFSMAEQLTDAYQIEFTIGCQLAVPA